MGNEVGNGYTFKCYQCGQSGPGMLASHESVCPARQISQALDKAQESHARESWKILTEGATETPIPKISNKPYSLLEKRIQDLCLGYSDSDAGFEDGYKEGFLQAIDVLTFLLEEKHVTSFTCLKHLKEYAGKVD